MAIGRKHEQSFEDAYPVEFIYSVTSSATDYMDVVLDAAHGPFGTRRPDVPRPSDSTDP